MSVSFLIQHGPRVVEVNECSCAQQGEPWEDCPHCGGTGEYSFDIPEHELNLANDNAGAMLRSMGIHVSELWGEVEAAGVADLRHRIISSLNRPGARAPHLRESKELKGGHAGMRAEPQADGTVRLQSMGAHTHVGGLSDEGLINRLERFDIICAKAQELGKGVCWS